MLNWLNRKTNLTTHWSQRIFGSTLVLCVQLLRESETRKKSSLEAVNGVI